MGNPKACPDSDTLPATSHTHFHKAMPPKSALPCEIRGANYIPTTTPRKKLQAKAEVEVLGVVSAVVFVFGKQEITSSRSACSAKLGIGYRTRN